MDWFLYDKGLRHERVNFVLKKAIKIKLMRLMAELDNACPRYFNISLYVLHYEKNFGGNFCLLCNQLPS